MKKKLMAVAVAGVLAAPAVAFAQASIYGAFNAEYGFADGVDKAAGSTNSWDGLNSPGSYIGFRGEEKLAGNMRAFFQCETDLGFLKGDQAAGPGFAATQGGWCSRNSALGLRGDFGSVYIGSWDSPVKRAVGATRITGETGWMGVQSMLISNGGGFTGTFSARNANSINYDSPNFSGFSISLQTTSTKAAATVTTAGLEGRSNSFNVMYAAGPMVLVAGYTKLDDNRTVSGVNGTTDTMVTVGGTYTFGPAKIGLTYVTGTAEPTTTGELKRKAWNIAGTWSLGGPHSLRAAYTLADDTEATGTAVGTAGTGDDTGANEYQIGYMNALSKRTNAGIAYIRASNDDRATGYSVGTNHATGLVAGSSSSAVVFLLNHTF